MLSADDMRGLDAPGQMPVRQNCLIVYIFFVSQAHWLPTAHVQVLPGELLSTLFREDSSWPQHPLKRTVMETADHAHVTGALAATLENHRTTRGRDSSAPLHGHMCPAPVPDADTDMSYDKAQRLWAHGWVMRSLGARSSAAIGSMLLVHGNIVAYAFAYWCTQPILPFLVKTLSPDPVMFGYFQTSVSLFQLIGGPLMGRLCDAQGPRIGLVVSQVGSGLSYMLLGMSTTVTMLFVGQAWVVLQHAMQCAQACVSQLSTDNCRAEALGRLSLSYGIGMILGSSAGGVLSVHLGMTNVAYIACAVSFLTVPVTLVGLHDTPNFTKTVRSSSPGAGADARPWLHIGSLVVAQCTELLRPLKSRAVRHLLMLQILVGLGLAIQRAPFSQALQLHFGLGAQEIGLIMSSGAIIGVVVNTFCVGWLVHRSTEHRVLMGSLVLLVFALGMYALCSSFRALLVLLVPLTAASTVAYTVVGSLSTKVVALQDTGSSIGLSHATRTLVGIFSPTLGSFLLVTVGFWSLGATAAVCVAVGLAYGCVCLGGASGGASALRQEPEEAGLTATEALPPPYDPALSA